MAEKDCSGVRNQGRYLYGYHPPFLPSMEGMPACVPIFPPRMSDLLGKKLWELELSVRREGCPTVSEAALAAKTVASVGFFRGVWDKKLTRMYVACSKLRDSRVLDDILINNIFSFWGGCQKG